MIFRYIFECGTTLIHFDMYLSSAVHNLSAMHYHYNRDLTVTAAVEGCINGFL